MSKHGMSSEQASRKKRNGHKLEERFHRQFNPSSSALLVNYSGSTADCRFKSGFPPQFYKVWPDADEEGLGVSIKSGYALQFQLGSPLMELTNSEYLVGKNDKDQTKVDHLKSFVEQVASLKDPNFWRKYLKKGDWMCHADLENNKWRLFRMEEIIDLLVSDKFIWDLLSTGRIKGRYHSSVGAKPISIITYEYRKKKKSFVLGANGGQCGKKFIEILLKEINYVSISMK